jgi:uncharacterized protein YjiK
VNPFDFINAINQTKEDLFKEPNAAKVYQPYLVNRSLSYFHDTIAQANVMNMHSSIPSEWQFQFLLNSITKKKRFSKWQKKDKATESLLLVQEYYGYSSDKAKEALSILSDEQLKLIEEKLNKGGK